MTLNKSLPPVRLNQLGYRPRDEKVACVADAQGRFEVLAYPELTGVLSGEIGPLERDPASGDQVAYADLTALTAPGTYVVRTDLGDSLPFTIGEDVYKDVLQAALRFFTLQRCGQDLPEALAGKHAHAACHLGEATVYGTDIKKKVLGGWHDAGDYGRYVSAAGKAVMDLLLAQRDYPDRFRSALLEEVRYELDWMLRMQDETTGGVYHKLTSKAFVPLDVMPDTCSVPMYLSPISSTATGDFAGVCAYASLFYRQTDPVYADTLVQAAKKAYAWLKAHPDVPGFKNPPGISTGEYGDEDDSDERALAAAALCLASGEPDYVEDLRPLLGKSTGTGWEDMGLYAVLLYLQMPQARRDEALFVKAKETLLKKARELARAAGREAYGVTLGSDQYIWGSNMDVASHGMVLLLADDFAPGQGYRQTAQNQLHYLLGRNANCLSFITGFGSMAARHPHHRPSVSVKEAMPGMLAGGPNSGLQDGIDKDRLSALPPARQYIDHWDAYASNEVTIYWNSPLVYLLAAFQ